MPKRSRSYEVGLSERLKDPEYALAYLEAAWEDTDEVFLLALRDVATARGISAVANAAGVNRENLYRGLSKKGNPTFSTLRSVLKVLKVPFGPCGIRTHAETISEAVGMGPFVTAAVVNAIVQHPPECREQFPASYCQVQGHAPAPWWADKLTEMEMEASLYSVQ
jgi:probable addiction module antidote protein